MIISVFYMYISKTNVRIENLLQDVSLCQMHCLVLVTYNTKVVLYIILDAYIDTSI